MSNKNTLMKNKLKYENAVFTTKMCGDCIVTAYEGAHNIEVRFDDTGFETVVTLQSLKKGDVKDRLKPSFYGVGIIGKDFVEDKRLYNIWVCMLTRCYGALQHKPNSPYAGCTVSENFKYFPYFKDWCEKQIGFDKQDDKFNTFALDKDILLKGNKVYSENTCCFVPQEINGLQFSSGVNKGLYPLGVHYDKRNGKYVAQLMRKNKVVFLGRYKTPEEAFSAYKVAKELHIKEITNKWKTTLDLRTYNALMAWEVNIDD